MPIHHGGASPTLQKAIAEYPDIAARLRSLSAQPTGTESKQIELVDNSPKMIMLYR